MELALATRFLIAPPLAQHTALEITKIPLRQLFLIARHFYSAVCLFAAPIARP